MDDVSVGGYSMHTPEGRYDLVSKTPEFFRGTTYIIRDGELVKLEIPEDASMQGIFKEQMLVSLRTDWTVGGRTYPADALLAIGLEDFLAGGRDFATAFPAGGAGIPGRRPRSTLNYLLVSTMDNVRSKLYKYSFTDGGWTHEEVELPGLGSAGVTGTSDLNDDFFINYTDFLTPSSLYFVADGEAARLVKSTPEFFDATGMNVDQYEAKSADGTKIPYFIFMPKGLRGQREEPDPALRLRRVRGQHAAPLLRRHRRRLGGARRRLRAGEHPRRRRVRPQMAPGRHAGKAPELLRRLHRRGRGPDRPQDHLARAPGHRRRIATAACWSAAVSCSGPNFSRRSSARFRCWT